MPSSITLLKLIALAGAGGAAAYFLAWHEPQPRSPASAESAFSSSATAAFSPADSNRFYLPVAGRRYIYGFERKIHFEGTVAGAQLPNLAYNGELYIDVLRADARAFEALVSQRIKESGGRLSPSVRIEVDARGDQLSLFTSSEQSEEDKQHVQVIKDLLALWLFPLRSDTVGSFEARFDTLPAEEGVSRERKAKLSYVSKEKNIPQILASLHLLRWNTSIHLPDEIRGQESTRLGASTASPLTAASDYGLKFRSFEPLPKISRALLASLRLGTDLQLHPSAPDFSQHPDYAKLNWATISQQLRGLGGMNGGEQLEVFGDLLKYLRLHPEKLAEINSMLRDPQLLKAGIQSPLFKTLVGALATLGSAEALEALRNTYEEPALSDQARNTILASITTTQAPIDSATRDFLAQKMQSEKDPHLSQGAAFALGSALQNAGNDEQSVRAIAQIEQAWQTQARSGSVGDQLALLDVMGNSGRTEFYPTVQAALIGESSAIVKARAVFSLRFMTNSQAANDLVARLSDPEPLVREAAANAMEYAAWKESFRTPLEVCAGAETVVRVQTACRNVLSNKGQLASN